MWLAYKYVAVAVMLAEANYCAQQLDLRVDLPIQRNDLQVQSVMPPEISGRLTHFSGRIDTADYSFCFPEDGRLRYVYRLTPFGDSKSSAKNYEPWEIKSVITTNEAYQISSNWLNALSVDVCQLEKNCPVQIKQQISWGKGGRMRGYLPIFDVRWGTSDIPEITITIDGRNKALRILRLERTDFSTRPTDLIKDVDKLMRIADEEFLKYSPAERDQLVARFSAVTYPPLTPSRGATAESNGGVKEAIRAEEPSK